MVERRSDSACECDRVVVHSVVDLDCESRSVTLYNYIQMECK